MCSAYVYCIAQTKITLNYENDSAQGRSTFVSNQGQIYQFNINPDLLNGFVSINFPNQSHFSGTYLNGFRNGEGKFLYPHGSVFKGLFKEDKKNGRGWQTLINKAAPSCSSAEYRGSLGDVNSANECLKRVEGSTARINYAVWRGDSNKGCYVCII